MRKLSLLMIITVLFTFVFSVNVYANQSNSDFISDETCITISEYEWLRAEAKKSESKLIAEGYSEESVDLIKNYKLHYKEQVESLDKLSDEVLKAFDYNDKQIEIIRNYKGTEAEMEALSAKCTLTVTTSDFVYKTYTTGKLSFEWVWSRRPVAQSTDLIAAGWNDFAITDDKCQVTYYDMTTGKVSKLRFESKMAPKSTSSGIEGAGYKIDLVNNNDFAKAGVGYFKLQSDVKAAKDFYYGIAYGHTQLAVNPSFSVSSAGLDISIAFKSGINTMDSDSGRVVPK